MWFKHWYSHSEWIKTSLDIPSLIQSVKAIPWWSLSDTQRNQCKRHSLSVRASPFRSARDVNLSRDFTLTIKLSMWDVLHHWDLAALYRNTYSLLHESISISNFRLVLLLPFPRAGFSPGQTRKNYFGGDDKIHAEKFQSHSIASGFLISGL